MIKPFEKFINEDANAAEANAKNTFKFELTDSYPTSTEELVTVLERAIDDIKHGMLNNTYRDLAIGWEITELDEWGEPI